MSAIIMYCKHRAIKLTKVMPWKVDDGETSWNLPRYETFKRYSPNLKGCISI